jgi:hypothetical protein
MAQTRQNPINTRQKGVESDCNCRLDDMEELTDIASPTENELQMYMDPMKASRDLVHVFSCEQTNCPIAICSELKQKIIHFIMCEEESELYEIA